MRNCRALLLAIAALIVLVIALLFALLNRHSTITTVVSSGGLVGGSAKAGDTIAFRTYQGGILVIQSNSPACRHVPTAPQR